MKAIVFPPDYKFDIKELVHPDLYNIDQDMPGLWHITQFQVDYTHLIRTLINSPLIVNNWHIGGKLIGRGTRPRKYKPLGGSEYSQHYLGNAVDISSQIYSTKKILECIFDNKDKFCEIGVTTIEDINITKKWLHVDCRPVLNKEKNNCGFKIVTK